MGAQFAPHGAAGLESRRQANPLQKAPLGLLKHTILALFSPHFSNRSVPRTGRKLARYHLTHYFSIARKCL